MRRLFILSILFLFTIATVGAASAIPVTVTYTADNVVDSWYQNGGAPVSLATGSNANDWRYADTLVLFDITPGNTYQLVWEVSNAGSAGSGNPAAFLAQIDLGDNIIVSSSSFMWDDSGKTDDFNDASWVWQATTEYGNNGGNNIWNNVFGPVEGIDATAQWIWADTNFASLNDQHIFIKAEFTTAPVPEPTTILLLGTGLAGLAGVGRRKFFKK